MLSGLPKVTQLINGGAGIEPQTALCSMACVLSHELHYLLNPKN